MGAFPEQVVAVPANIVVVEPERRTGRDALGDLDVRFEQTPQGKEVVSRMSLGEEDEAVFRALQSPLTVGEIFQRFPRRDLAIGQLLWALQTTHAISRASPICPVTS